MESTTTANTSNLSKRAQAILNALTALGNTAAQLAASLRTRKVEAEMGEPSYCAIADYMKHKFKCDDVHVTEEYIVVGNDRIETPKHAREFIEKFDDYDYPYLVKDESEEDEDDMCDESEEDEDDLNDGLDDSDWEDDSDEDDDLV